MTWEQFYKALEAGRIDSVYWMYGPEEHVKASALQALRRKLLPGGLEAMNETVLDGADARQIIEAAETLPMLCERRLVLVRDWAPLMPGKAKNEEREAAAIAEWLPAAPESCCVVFYLRGDPDARKKAVAALKKHASVVNFDLLDDANIAKWVNEKLRPLNKSMDREAVEELAFRAGRELTRLGAELEKLGAYALGRERITREDVETLVAPSPESTVFQMIDRLMAGDAAGAERLMKSLLIAGESRVGVLFMLTRQLRNLLHIRLLEREGLRLPEIEKRLGLSRFVAGRARAQAVRFSLDGLKAGYRACLDAEFDIKSGKLRDAPALDRLMLTLGDMR